MRGAGLLALFVAWLDFAAGMRTLLVDAAACFFTHHAIEMHAAWWLAVGSGKGHSPRRDLHQRSLFNAALLSLLPVEGDAKGGAAGTAGDAGGWIVGHAGHQLMSSRRF